METKTYTTMNYVEWDDLVKEYFPKSKEYTIVASEELNNNSTWESSKVERISFVNNMKDEYGLTYFGKFIIGKWDELSTEMILEFFVWMGILPEGNYIIKVSW